MSEEEAPHTLEAVRLLLRAGDYHLAEANRRETAWKAKVARSIAAREEQEVREGLADDAEREKQEAIRTDLDQQNLRESEAREEAWRIAQN